MAATRALTEAIQLPEILNFESLVELDAVKTLKNEKLFELLKIFLGSTLKEYKTFTEQNPGLVEKLGKHANTSSTVNCSGLIFIQCKKFFLNEISTRTRTFE